MPNTVRDWMSSPVVVILPEMSVRQALTMMRRHSIHSLIVDLTRKGEVAYGIITTTDIRDKIVASDREPSDVTVEEIMTAPVVCAFPDWDLKKAALKMQDLGIHHLPVQDERGTLIGMISATDIFIAVEESGWQASI
jgi:CBS domain-containing protein